MMLKNGLKIVEIMITSKSLLFELKKAKEWWNNMTKEMQANFPHYNPTDTEVLAWYSDPAEYSLPPNII